MAEDVATASKPPVTVVERVGTGVTVASVVALGAYFIYPLVAPTITSLDQVKGAMTIAAIAAGAAAVLGLVGTALNLPGLLKERRLGRGLSTFFSGAILITAALAFVVGLLPKVNNLNYLQDTIAPFGKVMKDSCQTPLDKTTQDYKDIRDAANGNQINPSNFATAMVKALTTIKADETALNGDLTKLNAAVVPDKGTDAQKQNYQFVKNGCTKDVQSTLAFFTSNTGITPDQVTQILTAAGALIDSNAAIPATAKPLVKASLKLTLPSSLSAEQLLTAAPLFAQQKYPIKTPDGLDATTAATIGGITSQFLQFGISQVVAGIFDSAANQTDKPLTDAATQLTDNIKSILNDNVAPFKIDAQQVVDNA